MIENLTSNAIKFTDRGGVIISCVDSFCSGEEPRLEIHVCDTGLGIAEDDLERIFEPFAQVDETRTRQFGGTGLGLAIVKDLMEQMKGEVSVNSKPGEGTEFILKLPSAVEDTSDAMTDQAKAPKLLAGKRILVVDDFITNLQVAAGLLEFEGAVVSKAESGIQALEALSTEEFDLVVLDLVMPEMDGFAVLREMRNSSLALPPVIAATANSLLAGQTRCLDAGFSGYITKPLDAAELYSLCQDVMKAAAPAIETGAETRAS